MKKLFLPLLIALILFYAGCAKKDVSELQKNNQPLNNHVDELEKENQFLNKEVDKLGKEYEFLTKQVSELEKEKQSLRVQVYELGQDNQSSNKQDDKLEKKIAFLNRELEKQKSYFKSSQRTNNSRLGRINSLKDDLASQKAFYRELIVGPKPIVRIKTNKGDIFVALDPERAPITVANFLQYTNDKFYDGLIFHRVMRGLIQGGGYNQQYVEKETRAPIKNEADNGLMNVRGTIAMARKRPMHSATSQFFINAKENNSTRRTLNSIPDGYTVFGKVIIGMDVVDIIRHVKTTQKQLTNNEGQEFDATYVPVDSVIIESVTVIKKRFSE